MPHDMGSGSTGGVLVHSFAIDVKGGVKKNVATNVKGGGGVVDLDCH